MAKNCASNNKIIIVVSVVVVVVVIFQVWGQRNKIHLGLTKTTNNKLAFTCTNSGASYKTLHRAVIKGRGPGFPPRILRYIPGCFDIKPAC